MKKNLDITNQFPQSPGTSLNRGSTVLYWWLHFLNKCIVTTTSDYVSFIESSSTSPKKKHKRKHKKHKKRKDHGPEGYDEERKKEKSKDKSKSREKEKDKGGGRAVKLKIKLRGETMATTQWVYNCYPSPYFWTLCARWLLRPQVSVINSILME